MLGMSECLGRFNSGRAMASGGGKGAIVPGPCVLIVDDKKTVDKKLDDLREEVLKKVDTIPNSVKAEIESQVLEELRKDQAITRDKGAPGSNPAVSSQKGYVPPRFAAMVGVVTFVCGVFVGNLISRKDKNP